ncbi:hypothetical protein [Pseudomonas kulmbachensis]|uniref:hypothetical protein n=1 Tax=Pseudomonas kulmbachensis TaxID=3043408 RepID=UPI002AB1AA01|nr:hypothetical protein [Pseudomonas sp. V3/3/4/13]
MKKLNREKIQFILNAGSRRFHRQIRRSKASTISPPQTHRKKRQHITEFNQVSAPAKLDLYSPKNHEAFVNFLSDLRKSVKNHKKTFVSFRNSTRITASAGLMLVAETDRLLKAFPNSKIRCSCPPKVADGKYKNNENLVEGALNKIGFFSLIGQPNSSNSKSASVSMWKQLSGETADGSLADSLLKSLSDRISDASRKKIYRGAIEAIANCVEHAYPYARSDGLAILDSRWWMLVGIDNNSLCIIVCDLGVGIPETLPKKHPEKLLELIKDTFGIFDSSDSEMIRASTHIRQTRTKLSNRGRGGKDFRSITKNFPTATLIIRSNKGAFFITGNEAKPLSAASSRRYVKGTKNMESTLEHKKSIHGTLIEWIVPLQDLEK